MSSPKSLRRQLFVDPKVQGSLVWRSILYWCMCMAAVTLMLLCWRILTGPARLFYMHLDDMWYFYGPALVASAFILPVILVDVVRWSNRFAGPMLRLRRSMRELARGEHVEPIRFRDNDFWHDFAEEFNAVVARVQGDAIEQPVTTKTTTEPPVATATTGHEEDSELEAVGSHRP